MPLPRKWKSLKLNHKLTWPVFFWTEEVCDNCIGHKSQFWKNEDPAAKKASYKSCQKWLQDKLLVILPRLSLNQWDTLYDHPLNNPEYNSPLVGVKNWFFFVSKIDNVVPSNVSLMTLISQFIKALCVGKDLFERVITFNFLVYWTRKKKKRKKKKC